MTNETIFRCEACGEIIPEDEVTEWDGEDDMYCHVGVEGCPQDGWDFYPCGPVFMEVNDAKSLRE